MQPKERKGTSVFAVFLDRVEWQPELALVLPRSEHTSWPEGYEHGESEEQYERVATVEERLAGCNRTTEAVVDLDETVDATLLNGDC